MLNKLLFNLTAVFLIFYISATSATPAALPSTLGEVNEDIHARTIPRRPIDTYRCRSPYTWKRRECLPLVSPRAYQDVCAYSSYRTNYQLLYQNVQAECPENFWCLNTGDEEGRRFTQCVPVTPSKRFREGDPQVGASDRKRARPTLDASEFQFSLTLENDMKGAYVGAVVQSDDGDFILAPQNVIVGKIHGKEVEVCTGDQSDASKARECYGNGTYDLKKGNVIDFTWAMSNDQEGILLAGIVPAPT